MKNGELSADQVYPVAGGKIVQIKQILSLIEEQQMSPDAGLELIRTYRKEQMEKRRSRNHKLRPQPFF
ncbi:hypothetical protein QNN00_21090 [Bacillus velezensis]|nr:hypothetical protein [Bacillus velezensis]